MQYLECAWWFKKKNELEINEEKAQIYKGLVDKGLKRELYSLKKQDKTY